MKVILVSLLCGDVGQSSDDGAEDTERDVTTSVRQIHAVRGADDTETAGV